MQAKTPSIGRSSNRGSNHSGNSTSSSARRRIEEEKARLEIENARRLAQIEAEALQAQMNAEDEVRLAKNRARFRELELKQKREEVTLQHNLEVATMARQITDEDALEQFIGSDEEDFHNASNWRDAHRNLNGRANGEPTFSTTAAGTSRLNPQMNVHGASNFGPNPAVLSAPTPQTPYIPVPNPEIVVLQNQPQPIVYKQGPQLLDIPKPPAAAATPVQGSTTTMASDQSSLLQLHRLILQAVQTMSLQSNRSPQTIFNGRASDFLPFISGFEMSIDAMIDDPRTKLMKLFDVLGPSVQKRIRACKLMKDPKAGYDRAIATLYRFYGSCHHITERAQTLVNVLCFFEPVADRA